MSIREWMATFAVLGFITGGCFGMLAGHALFAHPPVVWMEVSPSGQDMVPPASAPTMLRPGYYGWQGFEAGDKTFWIRVEKP